MTPREIPGGLQAPVSFDEKTEAAASGIWACELATQKLRWSGGVFSLFGLPDSARLDRREIVEMYCDHSREEMEWLRAEAISRRCGFSLEAEIQRADGSRRWMLLTARVHSRNGRPTHIFGSKRDITDVRRARASLISFS